MRKHIVILASIFIFFGAVLSVFFIYGHVQFLMLSPSLFSESSILDESSFLTRWRHYFDVYLDFFARFDINPIFSLFTIITAIFFGYGLLKSKKWAVYLGFIILAVNSFSAIMAIVYGLTSPVTVMTLGLTAYMWWILTSQEVKKIMETKAEDSTSREAN